MSTSRNPTAAQSSEPTARSGNRARGHVRLVHMQPEPQASYEQATFALLAERAHKRLRDEWNAAGMAHLVDALETFIQDAAPSVEETAARLGIDPDALMLEAHRLRIDWLELLAEEAEAELGRISKDSMVSGETADASPGESDAQPVSDDAYQLLGLLGSGLHGHVYRARHCRSDTLVALKVFDGKDRDLERFHMEFELASKLEHPYIARVRKRGVIGGRPCFSMDLVDGGTLADEPQLRRFRVPELAAALVVKIARAVQFAHERGILHRDLKPSNILVDQHGEPRLSDFSLGLKLGDERSHSGAITGTFAFMAPEQAGARDEPLSTATDVYGLGAILYKLLTGEAPNPQALMTALRRFERAEPPRRLTPEANPNVLPGVSADLEAVCLKALEPAPASRYSSAAAFADDLERALQGRPTLARPPGAWGRIVRWVRRHPVLTWVAVSATAAVLTVNGAMLLVLHSQHEEILQATLKENATLATLQARHVSRVLEDYAERVAHVAAEPVVRNLALGPTRAYVLPELQPLSAGFDSLLIVHRDGRVRARWPHQADAAYYSMSFAFRDYFAGANRLPNDPGGPPLRGVYLSRVFRSKADDHNLKFALSAPIYDENGVVIGFAVVTKSASSTLENVPFQLYGGQITALLAPRDADREGQPRPQGFSVLVHDDVDERAEYAVAPQFAARALAHFGGAAASGQQFEWGAARPLEVDDYKDPVPGYGGRWVAGFYPVARTGYLVGVGTPYRGVSPLLRSIFVGVNAAFAVALIVALSVLARRSRKAAASG